MEKKSLLTADLQELLNSFNTFVKFYLYCTNIQNMFAVSMDGRFLFYFKDPVTQFFLWFYVINLMLK
jgi:hypothetical protein